MHPATSLSSVSSLKVKLFFLSTGKIQNFIAPSLVGRLIKTLQISALLRSKTLFFTVTMTVTILFTTILIDEVSDFTIKMG
jgi:hypothetical protein